jgi:hypothetical protein
VIDTRSLFRAAMQHRCELAAYDGQ